MNQNTFILMAFGLMIVLSLLIVALVMAVTPGASPWTGVQDIVMGTVKAMSSALAAIT